MHTVATHIAKNDFKLVNRSRWVMYDAKGLRDSLCDISDSKIQSSSAVMLIVRDDRRDILTDDQIEYARKYATGNSIQSTEQLIEKERIGRR